MATFATRADVDGSEAVERCDAETFGERSPTNARRLGDGRRQRLSHDGRQFASQRRRSWQVQADEH